MRAESPTPDPSKNPMRYDPTDEGRIIATIKRRHPQLTNAQIRKALEELIKEGILIPIKH